jgi:hypothetical protein
MRTDPVFDALRRDDGTACRLARVHGHCFEPRNMALVLRESFHAPISR